MARPASTYREGLSTRKHGGFPLAEARCTSRHDPHASEGKALLAEVSHMPFGDIADCGSCHQDSEKPPRPTALEERGLGVFER